MDDIDKIIFGDNQFFGINHMSQEKAQQQSEKFDNMDMIIQVYSYAFEAGIRGIMLNSNDKAKSICDYFIKNKLKFSNLNWYPSIPYPHKYANLVSEKGIIPAINDILLKNNSALNILSTIAKGGTAIINKDAVKLLQMLIDIEMKSFQNLNVKVIFLQNIITDLLLGYNAKDLFYEYYKYVTEKYKVIPGFITQNLPHLIYQLKNWEIENVAICASFNKIGYLMSPNIKEYLKVLKNNNCSKYQILTMSTLASGGINPNDAYNFIRNKNIQSVVFGASSKNHIQETVKMINRSI